jgi:hypothetical protein
MPYLPNPLYSLSFLIKILSACPVHSILLDFIVTKYLVEEPQQTNGIQSMYCVMMTDIL